MNLCAGDSEEREHGVGVSVNTTINYAVRNTFISGPTQSVQGTPL